MFSQSRYSLARCCGAVSLCCVLVAPLAEWLLSRMVAPAIGEERTISAAEGEPTPGAVTDDLAIGSGGAIGACPDQAVPALLALAPWPLDQKAAGQCMAAAGDPENDGRLERIEIEGYPPVIPVTAEGYRPSTLPSPGKDKASLLKSHFGQGLAAIDNGALDHIRGGFEMAELNLKLSFGFERVVFINDQLVASTALTISDLQRLSAGSVSLDGSRAALEAIKLGSGNSFSMQPNPDLAGTVLQNTLNGQKIQTITTINGSVNSVQWLRAMSLQSAIQNGLISSLRR